MMLTHPYLSVGLKRNCHPNERMAISKLNHICRMTESKNTLAESSLTVKPFKTIPLSKGAFAIVDAENYDEFSKLTWHLSCNGYAEHSIRLPKGKKANIFMHHLVLTTPKGYFTDHKNLNKLDNRKENLRLATKSGNASNSHVKSCSRTKVKGVGLHSPTGLYRARITKNGKEHHLGLFNTIEEAGAAYAEAAPKHHGEFARAK